MQEAPRASSFIFMHGECLTPKEGYWKLSMFIYDLVSSRTSFLGREKNIGRRREKCNSLLLLSFFGIREFVFSRWYYFAVANQCVEIKSCLNENYSTRYKFNIPFLKKRIGFWKERRVLWIAFGDFFFVIFVSRCIITCERDFFVRSRVCMS